jgi:hypothetical protein
MICARSIGLAKNVMPISAVAPEFRYGHMHEHKWKAPQRRQQE